MVLLSSLQTLDVFLSRMRTCDLKHPMLVIPDPAPYAIKPGCYKTRLSLRSIQMIVDDTTSSSICPLRRLEKWNALSFVEPRTRQLERAAHVLAVVGIDAMATLLHLSFECCIVTSAARIHAHVVDAPDTITQQLNQRLRLVNVAASRR
jgi:hypothetical protein